MNSKAPLVMMEQIIMILFFALAASVAIRVFVASDQLSLKKSYRDEALIQGRTIAERYKDAGGDMDKMVAYYGGSYENGVWTTYWSDSWKNCSQGEQVYSIVVEQGQDDSPYLGTSQISAVYQDGTVLYTFPVAWQEDNP